MCGYIIDECIEYAKKDEKKVIKIINTWNWQNIKTNEKFDIIDKPTRMGRWCNCCFNENQELVIPMNPNPRDKDLERRVFGRLLRGEATIEAI